MIRLNAIEEKECGNVFVDKEENIWHYIPIKKAESVSHRDVLGDIREGGKEQPVGILELETEEDGTQEIAVYPYREKLGAFQKVTGYIPVENDGGECSYVRIVQCARGKLLGISAIVLAVVLLLPMWFLLREKGPKLDDSAIAYQMPGGAKNEDPNRIMIPGYGTLKMNQTEGVVHTALVNPEGNPSYFTYSVVLADSGETLYQSDMLKPGTAIPEFEVQESLQPGTYDIVIQIETASLEDYTVKNNGGKINAKLEVYE